MKTYLTFGAVLALGGALLSLLLFFAGLHSDPAKFGMAQWVGGIGGVVISVVCLTLGIRARRAEVPLSEPFGYGRALGAGVLISVFAGIFGIFTNYLYTHVINPGFADVMHQAQVNRMEARGMSEAQIERMEQASRMFTNPILQAAFAFIGAVLFGFIFSLIIAAFLKRDAVEEIPALPEQ